MVSTQEKLDRLAGLQSEAAKITERFEQIKAFHMAPVKDAIDRAEGEARNAVAQIQPEIDALAAEIKADVERQGESVKGASLHAVYAKGRTSWDSKKLEGYAIAYPEILQARTVGKPSVSLRQIKQ